MANVHEPTWTWLPRYKHIRAEKHKGENFEAFVGAIVTALAHADIHDVSQLLEHRARDPKLRELEMPKKQQREWLRAVLKATAAQFPQPEGEGSPEVERPQDIQPQAPAPHLSAAEITAAALSPRDGQPSPRPYVRTYLSPAEMAAAAAAAVPEEQPTEEPTEEPAESEWHPPEPEMLTSSVASLTGAEERRPSLSEFKDIRAAALMEKSLLGICEEANPKLLAKLLRQPDPPAVTVPPGTTSPLMWALSSRANGRTTERHANDVLQCVQRLLAADADPCITMESGWTAFHCAARASHGNPAPLGVVMAAASPWPEGGPVLSMLRTKAYGKTPLDIARVNAKPKIVELLEKMEGGLVAAAQAMAPFVESIVIFPVHTPTRMMLCKADGSPKHDRWFCVDPQTRELTWAPKKKGQPSPISMEDMTGGKGPFQLKSISVPVPGTLQFEAIGEDGIVTALAQPENTVIFDSWLRGCRAMTGQGEPDDLLATPQPLTPPVETAERRPSLTEVMPEGNALERGGKKRGIYRTSMQSAPVF